LHCEGFKIQPTHEVLIKELKQDNYSDEHIFSQKDNIKLYIEEKFRYKSGWDVDFILTSIVNQKVTLTAARSSRISKSDQVFVPLIPALPVETNSKEAISKNQRALESKFLVYGDPLG